MRPKRPMAWEDRDAGITRLDTGVQLDTPAWLTWLDDPSTTSFAYPVYNHVRGYIEGWMTVRKERRARGSAYWTAYWRVGGHLRKVYLGPATAVTDARLRLIGATWLAQIQVATDISAVG